jgi:hypothetical protein
MPFTPPILASSLSPILQHLIARGGGELIYRWEGGLGNYLRLEGNSLYRMPLPITAVDGRYLPAKIVPGFEAEKSLLPLTSRPLVQAHNVVLLQLSIELLQRPAPCAHCEGPTMCDERRTHIADLCQLVLDGAEPGLCFKCATVELETLDGVLATV